MFFLDFYNRKEYNIIVLLWGSAGVPLLINDENKIILYNFKKRKGRMKNEEIF